jgi:APA family basic amino acid/polyamine antiporter
MTETAPIRSANGRGELVRDLNVWHAGALVVGIIIGSGIFLVPKRMMEAAGTVELVLLAWIVGGLLSWFGSLTFAELAALKPGSGGEYVYIRDAYGGAAGFSYAWTTFLISKPASIATVAAGVVRILGEFPPFAFLQMRLIGGIPIDWGHVLASSIIVLFTWLNYLGVKKAGNTHLFFTLLKVTMILAIILICFTAASATFGNFRTSYAPAPGGMAGFMAALIAALWAYDGWNNVVMVAGEIRQPERNIPKALIVGIAIVGALYMLTYVAIQYVLPAGQIALANRPASLAIQYAMGPIGAMVISAGIAFSMFVTINGQILTGARIPFAAARDGYFFESLAQVHDRYHTPGPALLFQGGLTILLIFVGGKFEDLFNLALLAEWIFYMIAVSTVFVFRRREPDAVRSYRTFGYPLVPILFMGGAAVLLYHAFVQGQTNAIVGVIVILASLPVYMVFKRVHGIKT